MTNIINIEDEGSWPISLRDFLEEKLPILSLYMHKETSYSDLTYDEREYFRNVYKSAYESIIEKIETILSKYYILGYHCTRLLPSEIENIKIDGLKTLSKDFLDAKLKHAVIDQEIDREIANYILQNNLSDKINRKGLLHFTCSWAALQNENGVGKFFKAWGGESIYNIHENDSFSWNTISNIGKPAIIEVALLSEDTFNCWRIWDKIIDTFLENHDVPTENGKGTDARINYSLPPKRIVNIITIDSPQFLQLTDHASWSFRL